MSRTVRRYPRHLISLSQGFDDYMAKFSAKTRSTLRRKVRRIAERSGGEIRWEEFRTRADLARFFPPAAALSAKTYQERLLHAGLPDSKTFVKSAFESADHGRVRAYLLYLDDCPVAYMYLPMENGRVVYAHLGYDPSFAKYSPGTVLHMLVLQKLFEDPAAKVFDFTEGAGAHKELFATHKVECADVFLAPRRWTANALLSAHAAFAATERTLVALLDRIGIKRHLKRLLRRH
jgi:CelD/BcsL family acetyltransferase involved in cellulose biosynthesis